MPEMVEVYINDTTGRRLVRCSLVKRNAKTVWVKLPGSRGAIIKRKIRRDVPALRWEL